VYDSRVPSVDALRDGGAGGGPAPRTESGDDRCSPSGVCLLTGEFPPDAGGVGDYTARFAEALATLGVPVGVLTRRRAGRPLTRRFRRPEAIDAPVVPVYARIEAWDVGAWRAVLAALRRLGPRPVLHIQFQAGAFDLGGAVHLLPLVVRARLPAARVVTTFHDFLIPYLFPKAGPLRPAANRLLARSSHAAIFAEPADLAAAGPGVRGYLVPIGSNVDADPPPGFDRANVRRLLRADGDTLLIGYFGFLNASKGAGTLLEAVRLLVSCGRRVRLALIGAQVGASDATDRGQAEEVRRAIERLGLADVVSATGHLPAADASAALLACDLLALPYRDGASLRRGTLMAGLAHGLPIVSTLVGPDAQRAALTSARPVGDAGRGQVEGYVPLRDGQELLLVPPDDPAALADRIARLADDAELRARLAGNARAVAERIAWPAIARRTLGIYRETFNERARRTEAGRGAAAVARAQEAVVEP
jgi:glycosyltransferase involved in cell wall biosynthesis